METGRVIYRRYLLQRLLRQGQVCAVYQGVDQLLQRVVTVKVVPASYMATYQAASRLTAQLSHPNIIGLYDLIPEADSLYMVQEYVDGDDFASLLQLPLHPYEVADLGAQISSALAYAASSSRNVYHGDLTPAAIFRDRYGYARINNFALPPDMQYFTSWSVLGGDGIVVSDADLPPGQISEGRMADDVRAVGLLLYQLLASRNPSTLLVDPPADGMMRFSRNIPPELCQVVARAVIRQHPERITRADVLQAELKAIAEALEPAVPVLTGAAAYPLTEPVQSGLAASSRAGNPVNAFARYEGAPSSMGYASNTQLADPSPNAGSPTIADVAPFNLAAQQSMYPADSYPSVQPRTSSGRLIVGLIAIGLLAFALFFIVGYFLGHSFFPG